MEGAFGATGRRRLPVVNVTPLVDVLLLLIIFFAVTTSFERPTALDVTLPTSTEASAQAPVQRAIVVSAEGRFSFGEAINLSAEQLEAEVRKSLAEEPDALVALQADRANYGAYITALDVTKRAGVKKLLLQTQQGNPLQGE